jgi:three-Cys-motif partner protein
MSTAGDFFDDDPHEASRLKIEAYGKYLKPFAYKLLSWNRRLYVVDGFAGAGRYKPKDDGVAVLGSPMVAARMSREINLSKGRTAIRLINVEKDAGNYTELTRNLAGFGDLCHNFLGEFAQKLDAVLLEIGEYPALFFLDSFGMQAADVRVIDYILERRPGCVTEFLIHFSDKALTRVAGNLYAKTKRDVDRRAAETKLRNMDAILDTNWWRGCFTNPKLTTAEKRCSAAAELYMERLRSKGILFVNEMRMRDAYDDPPRYRLIFATKSAHGTFLMNDIAAGHEADLFKARFEGSFDVQLKQAERHDQRAALRSAIHSWALERGGWATPLEVLMHFTPIEFGRWRSSDYNECLRELVRLGGIDRPTPRGIEEKEKLHFIPIAQASFFDTIASS